MTLPFHVRRDRPLVPAPALFVASGTSLYAGSALAVGLFALMPAHTVAWWRVLVSAVLLLLWRRPWRTGWTARTFAGSALFGVVLAGMNMLFYQAIDHLPMGTAVSLEYVGPVILAAWGSRSVRARSAVVLAALGVLSIGGLGLDWSQPGTAVGVGFALAAGAAWAGYIVLGRRIAAARDGLTSLSVGMAAGAVVFAPLAVGTAAPALGSPLMMLSVLGVAVLSSVVPYALDQVVLTRLPSAAFAVLTALLPAISVIVAFLVLGQLPSAGELLGVVLVSVAVALTGRD